MTNPLAVPVWPEVVPIRAPILKSCEPSITALPSRRHPMAKSPLPTGHERLTATSAILRILLGTTIASPESAKFDVKVVYDVVKVAPEVVRVMYCAM
jgi:hypothetical protein